MIPEFTELDITIIQKELGRKSYDDIAFLIDKTAEEVKAAALIISDSTGIIPYQRILDEKRKVRPVIEKTPRARRVKKPKEPVIISRVISKPVKHQVVRRPEKRLASKNIDWSQMVTVKIDRRTSVMARRDEDPAAVREKFMQNQKKYIREFASTKVED
jgi:hypothetical protein